MEKIKSTYIIQKILSYTDDIIKFKLFTYSKKYQKLLNIGLLDYQKKFFDKIKMNSLNIYFKYLYGPKSRYNFSSNDHSYNKNAKNELLKKKLLKYNINIDDFKNYVKNYFVKYKEIFIKELNQEYKNKKQSYDQFEYIDIEDIDYICNTNEIRGFQEFSEGIKLEIDINSPLFDIFCESELFGELFIIPIDFKFINKHKLKEDYINTFNKLNDIDSNYSSIFLQFNDDKDISHLKDFNIKFNKIKNLNIKIFNPKKNFDYNSFYRELFSLKDIENNIIDLYIKNYSNRFDDEIDENILENLNKFKKLENLKLDGLNAKNIFELKIKTLKALNTKGCQNISINSDTESSIKKLISPYIISKSLLKLPQLEYLDTPYFSSIDFNSLNNLKKIKFYLGEQFTKILAIKSLKKIHITGDLDDLGFDLASIHDKNPSVNKLIYYYIKDDDYNSDYNINEILNKFPNLTELIFKTDLSSDRWCKSGGSVEINLEIKENSNCKINKLTLLLYFGNIKVYCQNFENLEKFEIKAYKIVNISTSIPMLSNNRNIIYKFLIELYLHLEQQLINLEIFKNLNNSIDNMQNLKRIDLYFMTNIDKNTYEEFIKKILSLKLDFINIDFRFVDKNGKDINESYFNNDDYYYYSYEELKRINKNILYLNFENIKINKYPDNK